MSKVYDRLEYYAKLTPNHRAVTYRVGEEYKFVDYSTLTKMVDLMGCHFKDYKNKTIAIIGHNKLEYVVSLLSILSHIGDAFLIDKELKKEDIEVVFSKKKPDLIILDDEINLEFDNYPVVKFSEVREIIQGDVDFEVDRAHAGNLILHTSGTTGEPKCVCLTEENYYGVIPEINKKWEVVSENSTLYIIPLYHIYAVTTLLNDMYTGADNILEWDYSRVSQVLAQTKPHLFMGVPLMYNRIMEAFMPYAKNKELLAEKVKEYFGGNYVFGCSAGSLLPEETSRFFNELGLPVYNVYGMTETSGPIAISYKDHNRYDSVGEILDINEVKIIEPDENGIGRVCIKGSNVFSGYLANNFENDECFIDGYFDTGDLGYIKDKFLYVIGRRKDILIGENGKNVSKEELRQKILENPAITECEIEMENNKIVAKVKTSLDEAELDNYIKKINEDLPNYKKIFSLKKYSNLINEKNK